MSLKQNIAVKAVAVYVADGFVLMEVLYLGVWCRPFNQYWAVPPNNRTSVPGSCVSPTLSRFDRADGSLQLNARPPRTT